MLDNLNSEQKRAVKQIDGPLLILAGAGSGKTKTITTRLAYLISLGIDPKNTLTLTFTNKAASEMRERALSMLDDIAYPPLLCTFHKFGLLFLKFNIHKIGRENNFNIIDSDDKKRILKKMESELPIAAIGSEISRYKNSLVSPEMAMAGAEQNYYKKIATIYQNYEEYLRANNLVDFDDLLLLTYQILEENPDLAKETSEKYKYIMVDEYQDTNELQYKLLGMLCCAHDNICVVGDDDQSIYGWRGANVRNILDFEKSYEDTTVIKLESNYRSTKQILKGANTLIEHNRERLGKKLVSVNGDGKDINVIESNNENEEANKIAKRINKLILDDGASLDDIAILYRVNALSRSLEEGLNKARVPYKLVGGVRFYDRAEIKDLISFFRVITHLEDDFSIRRIINKPKRGIGKTTIEKLDNLANQESKSIFEILDSIQSEEVAKLVGKKNATTLKKFIENLKDLAKVAKESPLKFIDAFEETFEFRGSFGNLPDKFDRVANVDEFYGYFRDFIIENPELDVVDFLNNIALKSDQDMISNESITIMSIHASKGLEYKYIFVIGLEEGFFPILGDDCDIEEERRLGYVAITRAKEDLTLSHVKSRFYRGKRTDLTKSRFLKEAGLVEGSLVIEKSSSIKKNDIVKHKVFGMGRVDSVSKAGKDFKLKINFGGTKREILSSFVEKIG